MPLLDELGSRMQASAGDLYFQLSADIVVGECRLADTTRNNRKANTHSSGPFRNRRLCMSGVSELRLSLTPGALF